MTSLLWLFLGFGLLRLILFGPARRWRRGYYDRSPLVAEKVARLEAQVTALQEQAEEDRALLKRLEEERDFFKQLYPAHAEHGARS